MEKQDDTLSTSLEKYESQLAQVRQAIKSTPDGNDKQDLYVLEKDIEELISLTKEALSNTEHAPGDDSPSADPFSQEYALFKAELAELEDNTTTTSSQEEANRSSVIPQEIQEDLDALKGSKCQAPRKQQWGDLSYHNALIVNIETNTNVQDIDHIQVRVLFVNPTERDMLPCPYFLEGECKFTDDKCHYSHGELVPLSDIREYREPDFSLIKEGSKVLAKQKDRLWHRATVQDILDENQCLVRFESAGREMVSLDLHDILPLESREDEEISSSSSSEEEDALPQEYFVELSLTRAPSSTKLGAWEEHTKGIGSRLMASMGYVVGCGLGKHGEGRLEPVEALIYPPGKSLDACMALREAAGNDSDLFKADRVQKKQARQLLRLQQQQQTKTKADVFSFINSKLAGSTCMKSESLTKTTNLASSSRKGLNVERFRLGEDIKRVQKDIQKFNQSLKRHEAGSVTHKAISNKLEEAQTELSRLENSDKLVAKEQNQRAGRKKITIF